MTFEHFATRSTIYITKFTGCCLLDKRTGKMIERDIYRMGGPDRHKLSDELSVYGFELKDVVKTETRRSTIDLRDCFNSGEEIEKR